MPQALENQARGFATHLGAKPGSERYDRIKYGTMRKAGWKPSHQDGKSGQVLGKLGHR